MDQFFQPRLLTLYLSVSWTDTGEGRHLLKFAFSLHLVCGSLFTRREFELCLG